MLKLISFFLISFIIVTGLIFPIDGDAQEGGATLYLSPATGTFFVGSTFSVSIFVNTGGNDINAVEVGLVFPADKLQVVSPTAGKSFISLWADQPNFSNVNGTLQLAGGVPSPGINTTDGLITSVVLRVRRPGEATIQFTNVSKVLKNDGRGTNILTSSLDSTYALLVPPPDGPEVISLTHRDQNRWYSNSNPTFSWKKEEGVNEFSYKLDANPRGVPDDVSEGIETIKEYKDIEDGIWYFHIKAQKTTWGAVTHFPIFIDTTPPASFTPEILPKNLTEIQKGILSFVTTDNESGLDHFEVKIENLTDPGKKYVTPLFIEASSPFRLQRLHRDKYELTVRAFDRAGNSTDESVVLDVLRAAVWERILFGNLRVWLFILLLVIIVVLIIAIVSRKRLMLYDYKRTTREVDKVFDVLEHDLVEKLEELERAKTERDLTQKERELHETLISKLHISENKLKDYLGKRSSQKKRE